MTCLFKSSWLCVRQSLSVCFEKYDDNKSGLIEAT